MTDLAIRPAPYALRTWWLSISAWLVMAWLGLHGLGVVMTLVLDRRLGFFPIWFLDCVACSAPEFSLPYGPLVVGGISLGAVVALPAAGFVLFRVRGPVDNWVFASGIALIGAMAIHVVVTWPVRYPGSLPPVAVAIVLPFASVLTGALGLFGVRREGNRSLVGPARVSPWAVLCLASGLISMALLGGMVSVASLAMCGWWIRSARPGSNRVLVICGGVLAGLSTILRALLRVRYPLTFGWLW